MIGDHAMFFTVGKIEKQLKEIKASIHRRRRDILQFKYMEGDCAGVEAPEFDDDAWSDFSLGGVVTTKSPGSVLACRYQKNGLKRKLFSDFSSVRAMDMVPLRKHNSM